MTRVFTLGTANRSAGDFLSLLRERGIARVADVRAFPDSSKFERFRRAAFEAFLEEGGVGYDGFGEELGGFRKGGYEAHAGTPLFGRGIERLATLARVAPTAFVCAERDPRACHRRFVADALARGGFEVIHLLGAGKRVAHADLLREKQGRLWG